MIGAVWVYGVLTVHATIHWKGCDLNLPRWLRWRLVSGVRCQPMAAITKGAWVRPPRDAYSERHAGLVL